MILLQPKRVDVLPKIYRMQRPRIPRGHTPAEARWYEIHLDPVWWSGYEHQFLRAWNIGLFENSSGEFVFHFDSWQSKVDTKGGYIQVDWPATFVRPEYFDGPNIRVFDLGPTPPLTLSDADRFGGRE